MNQFNRVNENTFLSAKPENEQEPSRQNTIEFNVALKPADLGWQDQEITSIPNWISNDELEWLKAQLPIKIKQMLHQYRFSQWLRNGNNQQVLAMPESVRSGHHADSKQGGRD